MPEITVTEAQLETAQQTAPETVAETDDDYLWLTERLDAQQSVLTSLATAMEANRTEYQSQLQTMEALHRENNSTLQTMIRSLTEQNAALQTAQADAFAAVLLKLTPENSSSSSQTVTEETVTEATPETVNESSADREGQTSAPSKRRRL